MAKTIGIDPGTTNLVHGHDRGRPDDGDRDRGGGRRTLSVVGFTAHGRAARRALRAPAADHEPPEHGLLDQAVHGPQFHEV